MFLRFARWVPANGILFALLIILATLIKSTPGLEASDADIVSYYGDNGNRTEEAVSLFLVGLAVLCFLSSLGALRGALARSEGEPRG